MGSITLELRIRVFLGTLMMTPTIWRLMDHSMMRTVWQMQQALRMPLLGNTMGRRFGREKFMWLHGIKPTRSLHFGMASIGAGQSL